MAVLLLVIISRRLSIMTAYKVLGFDIANYPKAYNKYHNDITLPLHICLTDELVEYVFFSFVSILNE